MQEARRYVMFLVVGLVAFVVAVPVLNALFVSDGSFDQLRQVVTGLEETEVFDSYQRGRCTWDGTDPEFQRLMQTVAAGGPYTDILSRTHSFVAPTDALSLPEHGIGLRLAAFAPGSGPRTADGTEVINIAWLEEQQAVRVVVGWGAAGSDVSDIMSECLPGAEVYGPTSGGMNFLPGSYTPGIGTPNTCIYHGDAAFAMPAALVTAIDAGSSGAVEIAAGASFRIRELTEFRLATPVPVAGGEEISHFLAGQDEPDRGGWRVVAWRRSGATFPQWIGEACDDVGGNAAGSRSASGADGNLRLEYTPEVPGSLTTHTPTAITDSVYAPILTAIFALIPLGLLLSVGWYFVSLYNGRGGGRRR